MLKASYPERPMGPIPTLLLQSLLAELALEERPGFDADALDEVETQRIYATFEGVLARAKVCCGLAGHDAQAAALLASINDLDSFLDGGLTVGGTRAVERKLDHAELEAVKQARRTMVNLLDWHFENGAGALLPVAEWLGLVKSGDGK